MVRNHLITDSHPNLIFFFFFDFGVLLYFSETFQGIFLYNMILVRADEHTM